MSKEELKGLIDMIDEKDVDTIFKVLIRFVPESEPLPDELEAISKTNESIEKYGTTPHDKIDWGLT